MDLADSEGRLDLNDLDTDSQTEHVNQSLLVEEARRMVVGGVLSADASTSYT